MCRSGAEGAQGCKARRCNGGLSHEAFLAKRRADYAADAAGRKSKRAAYYQATKNTKTADLPERNQHPVVSSLLSQGSLFERSTMSDPAEQLQIAKQLIENHSSSLTTKSIASEDTEFFERNESLNTVNRLTLEDGQVGYFKAYEVVADQESLDAYKQSDLSMMNNEVAAYQLSEALGENWSGMVPETVIREYNGQLGSFQAESTGLTESKYNKENDIPWGESLKETLGSEALQRAAVFDLLAGSQDRHTENFLIEKDSEGKAVIKLIDNENSFPENFNEESVNNDYITEHYENPDMMHTAVLDELKVLQLDPTSGGLDKLMSAKAYTSFRHRLDSLVRTQRVVQAYYFATGAGSFTHS